MPLSPGRFYWFLLVHLFPGFERAELPVVIEIDNVGVRHIDHHVRLPVSVDILETYGNNGEVFPVSEKRRAKIEFGMAYVPPWKLNDLNVPVVVDGDEVTRAGC